MSYRKDIPIHMMPGKRGVKSSVNSNLSAKSRSRAPASSTSEYLKQMVYQGPKVGGDANRRARSAGGGGASFRNPIGTRSPEDLAEELVIVKRNLVTLSNENTMLKTKVRRQEGSSSKAGAASLESSSASTVMVWTDPVSASSKGQLKSLQQKLMRLEQSLKDKDATLIKLRSDLKTTKIEEMRHQMNAFYTEIQRLQNLLESKGEIREAPRELSMRLKSLNETLLKQQEQIHNLTAEKDALLKEGPPSDAMPDDKDLKGMTKTKLLAQVAKLEKKLEHSKRDRDDMRLGESDVMSGLKAERDEATAAAERLRAERNDLRAQIKEKERESAILKKDLESAERKREGRREDDRRKEEDKRRDDEHRKDERHREEQRRREEDRRRSEDKDIELITATGRGHLARKRLMEKKDQHHSRGYDSQSDSELERRSDSGIDDAVNVLSSAFKGHLARKRLDERRRHSQQSDDYYD